MEQLQYHPNANARALAQQSTETLGLIVSDVSDPFFGAMVKAVEQVAYATHNFLLIGNGYHDAEKERQAIEQLVRHRCEALVVHAKSLSDRELGGWMQQIPGMVLINRTLPGFETRCVALDDRYGAWLATRHLIQQGHKRIAIICSTHQISDATDRLQGYLDALQEHGIAVDEKLIANGEPDEIGGEQAMTELLGRGRSFSAVTCYNDPMAAGALGAERQQRRRTGANFADRFRRRADFALPAAAPDHRSLPDRGDGDPGGGTGPGLGQSSTAAGNHQHVQPDAGAPPLGCHPQQRARTAVIRAAAWVSHHPCVHIAQPAAFPAFGFFRSQRSCILLAQ